MNAFQKKLSEAYICLNAELLPQRHGQQQIRSPEHAQHQHQPRGIIAHRGLNRIVSPAPYAGREAVEQRPGAEAYHHHILGRRHFAPVVPPVYHQRARNAEAQGLLAVPRREAKNTEGSRLPPPPFTAAEKRQQENNHEGEHPDEADLARRHHLGLQTEQHGDNHAAHAPDVVQINPTQAAQRQQKCSIHQGVGHRERSMAPHPAETLHEEMRHIPPVAQKPMGILGNEHVVQRTYRQRACFLDKVIRIVHVIAQPRRIKRENPDYDRHGGDGACRTQSQLIQG